MCAYARKTPSVVLVIVALTSLLRVLAQVYVPGFLKGDDVEVIQAAFNSAFDLPYEPWAIRNLLVPNVLVRPYLEVASALADPFR